MPTFEYSAIDRKGRRLSGRVSAPSPERARRVVEGRGLVVVAVADGATPAPRSRAAKPALGRRLGLKTLSTVTRQLSSLAAVAPLEEALRTLRDQADRRALREVLTVTHQGVVEGSRLSDAMSGAGNAFPPAYRAMIRAGEGAGALPQVLARLASLAEAQQDVRGRLASAIVYPAVLAVVALLVVIGLMTFVVPKVVDQFNASGRDLPALTEAVIGLSNLFLNWGWLIAIVAVGLGFAAAGALASPAVRLSVDRALLGAPVAGRLVRDMEAAGFARTLATMVASGVPVLEGVQLVAGSSRNAVFREAAAQIAASVREGGSLSGAMRSAGVFPPLLVYFAANGEAAGRLDVMLESAAEYLEREFRTASSVALSLLEPAIIVIMGGVVCLVILSILLPILQINTLTVS